MQMQHVLQQILFIAGKLNISSYHLNEYKSLAVKQQNIPTYL